MAGGSSTRLAVWALSITQMAMSTKGNGSTTNAMVGTHTQTSMAQSMKVNGRMISSTGAELKVGLKEQATKATTT